MISEQNRLLIHKGVSQEYEGEIIVCFMMLVNSVLWQFSLSSLSYECPVGSAGFR